MDGFLIEWRNAGEDVRGSEDLGECQLSLANELTPTQAAHSSCNWVIRQLKEGKTRKRQAYTNYVSLGKSSHTCRNVLQVCICACKPLRQLEDAFKAHKCQRNLQEITRKPVA